LVSRISISDIKKNDLTKSHRYAYTIGTMYVRKVFTTNVSQAVTLPKMLLNALDIHNGDLLWVRCERNEIVLRKIVEGEREIRDLVTRRDRRT
jgi:antitoxin component of MazEF toxin-antitoxin module